MGQGTRNGPKLCPGSLCTASGEPKVETVGPLYVSWLGAVTLQGIPHDARADALAAHPVGVETHALSVG